MPVEALKHLILSLGFIGATMVPVAAQQADPTPGYVFTSQPSTGYAPYSES